MCFQLTDQQAVSSAQCAVPCERAPCRVLGSSDSEASAFRAGRGRLAAPGPGGPGSRAGVAGALSPRLLAPVTDLGPSLLTRSEKMIFLPVLTPAPRPSGSNFRRNDGLPPNGSLLGIKIGFRLPVDKLIDLRALLTESSPKRTLIYHVRDCLGIDTRPARGAPAGPTRRPRHAAPCFVV